MSRPAFSRLPVTVDLPLLLQALAAIADDGEGLGLVGHRSLQGEHRWDETRATFVPCDLGHDSMVGDDRGPTTGSASA